MGLRKRLCCVLVILHVAACVGAAAAADDGAAAARQILELAGVRGGLVVHVGCGDGQVTAALRAADSFVVHGLDAAPAAVEKARQHIRSLGAYGKVSVERWTGGRLPYTDNLVNLLVIEDAGRVSTEEMLRVLAPDGVACVRKEGKWTRTIKPRPEILDEWTHALHGSDNNAVSKDTAVGPPRHLQWVADPTWARSHDHLASVSVAVSANGRLFSIVDEGSTSAVALPPSWRLVARDAFNGVLLWKRDIGPWVFHLRGFRSGPSELGRHLVAVGDRVYVTVGYGGPVAALDAATGKDVLVYKGTEGTTEIMWNGGVLFLVSGDPAGDTREATVERPANPYGAEYAVRVFPKRLCAIKADTGEVLWEKKDADTADVMPTTLAAANGRVFFQNTRAILCLDGGTGRELWRAGRPAARQRPAWSAPTLVVYGDVVLSADRAADGDAGSAKEAGAVELTVSVRGKHAPGGELIAFSAKDGKRLWAAPVLEGYNSPADVLVAGGLIWTGDLVSAKGAGITQGRDPMTGTVKRERPPDKDSFTIGMVHHRCYRNKATERYLLVGRAGVEFVDISSGAVTPNHWVRGACQYGIVPANGLLYAPSHSCACYIDAKLNGFCALAPARREDGAPGAAAERAGDGRLEKGLVYETPQPADAQTVADPDWPTYRCDPARRGRAPAAVSSKLKPAWTARIGGRLSALTVAEGKLFVASVDAHTLYALDAKDGHVLWSYTAGGRIDSPPTIYKGLALFGSADGWVYALRVSDGQLAWRFRAASEDRRLVAYEQLESVWPVHGSVLVKDDVAWFAAGRSSYVDGGITVYRLDPVTGRTLSTTTLDSRDPKTGGQAADAVKGFAMSGALPDVLSGEGDSVFMRHIRFDREGKEQPPTVPHLFSSIGFLDGSWWHRSYWFLGTRMGSGWAGWPTVGNQSPSGQLLVVGDGSVYGFGRTLPYTLHGSHVGIGDTGYRLFACAREPKAEPPAAKGPGKPGPQVKVQFLWAHPAEFQVRAMVLAGEHLFVAGPPLGVAPDAALEEGKRAVLWAVKASDGTKLAAYDLAAAPVFDGMAAAGGRLYIALQNGSVVCMGE